jgi:prepilin-type N-terminal cleavage/methylation domain-containing protein
MKRTGFSLVELSIVLVILGLLVGGVLAGQSLIHASQLRAVTTGYMRYVTATVAFNDKFSELPGDMKDATSYWGVSTACGGAVANGTCNGNGNGAVENAAAVSTSGEVFQFWNHLALAGLIAGKYTGVAGPTNVVTGADSVLGTNVPKGPIETTGWAMYYQPNYAGDVSTYKFDYGNTLIFGGNNPGSIPDQAGLKPEDAWNIDAKVDDGMPGTGKVMAHESYGWANAANGCTTSASNTDYSGNYNLQNSGLACSLKFPKVF